MRRRWMSAFGAKADMARIGRHVGLLPKADITPALMSGSLQSFFDTPDQAAGIDRLLHKPTLGLGAGDNSHEVSCFAQTGMEPRGNLKA